MHSQQKTMDKADIARTHRRINAVCAVWTHHGLLCLDTLLLQLGHLSLHLLALQLCLLPHLRLFGQSRTLQLMDARAFHMWWCGSRYVARLLTIEGCRGEVILVC